MTARGFPSWVHLTLTFFCGFGAIVLWVVGDDLGWLALGGTVCFGWLSMQRAEEETR